MGTDAWRNWRAFDDDKPEIENVDDELYSERQFLGGPESFGPYLLSIIIRQRATETIQEVGAAIRLHVGVHANLVPEIVVEGELVEPNSEAYHGGNASDEIAALAGLILGVRLRVAGTVQLSGIHEYNEVRQPIYLGVTPLAHPGRAGREYIPAALTRPADLRQLDRLESLPTLSGEVQVELVRAARAYAAGLWWANEDQNLSWLQFVTAVEIASNCRQKVQVEPEELVEDLWPQLWKVLQDADEPVRGKVSKLLAPQIRATRKFVTFLAQLAPDPPALRHQFWQLDWEQMEEHAKLIYGHRSTALHGGKPFPLPMLEQPIADENGAAQEVPMGLNTGGLGGVWGAEEAPMLLSTFEYIARGALLNWWDELIDSQSVSPTTGKEDH